MFCRSTFLSHFTLFPDASHYDIYSIALRYIPVNGNLFSPHIQTCFHVQTRFHCMYKTLFQSYKGRSFFRKGIVKTPYKANRLYGDKKQSTILFAKILSDHILFPVLFYPCLLYISHHVFLPNGINKSGAKDDTITDNTKLSVNRIRKEERILFHSCI